jgi:hypothetical protein
MYLSDKPIWIIDASSESGETVAQTVSLQKKKKRNGAAQYTKTTMSHTVKPKYTSELQFQLQIHSSNSFPYNNN